MKSIRASIAALAALGALRGQQETAHATLEALIVEALRDDDWQARAAAASLLGVFGSEHHADELQALLDDERGEVRGAAWYARLMLRPQKVERAIGCIAGGDTWADVSSLTTALAPLVQPEDAAVLTREFERAKSPHAQYALLLLLARAGATMSEPAAAYARMCETPAQILNASPLQPLLPDTPEQRERVTRWLEHENAIVRHRAAAWLLRNGATGAKIERHLIPDYVEYDDYYAETLHAAQALGEEWTPTTRDAVLRAVGQARIALVADSHGSKSIADLTVDCCAASLASGQRGSVAFGYETPVEYAFAAVKPRAEALGLEAVALEPQVHGWTDRARSALPSLRARDAAVNAALRAWLDRSPEHRMVALYGSNHVLGRGHIDVPGAVRILTCYPAHGLLQHLRAESLSNGLLPDDEHRWFAHRTQRDTFFVICDDCTWCPETRPAFAAWLAKKLQR